LVQLGFERALPILQLGTCSIRSVFALAFPVACRLQVSVIDCNYAVILALLIPLRSASVAQLSSLAVSARARARAED